MANRCCHSRVAVRINNPTTNPQLRLDLYEIGVKPVLTFVLCTSTISAGYYQVTNISLIVEPVLKVQHNSCRKLGAEFKAQVVGNNSKTVFLCYCNLLGSIWLVFGTGDRMMS